MGSTITVKSAHLALHMDYVIDTDDDRIFGGFLEHMDRSIYEWVYDPESTHADEDGIRTDVIEALRQLEMSVVRYPGGNFASGYTCSTALEKNQRVPWSESWRGKASSRTNLALMNLSSCAVN